MSRRFMENPAFRDYEGLLRELHLLMAAGLDESEAAEAIRERMEVAGTGLSREEVARLKALSADLYMLQGDEILEQVERQQRTRETLGAALEAAWERQEWEEALALLRKGPLFLSPAQVAYLRWRAYAALGHRDAGRLFLQHARRLDPDNVGYWVMLSEGEARRELQELSAAAGATAVG